MTAKEASFYEARIQLLEDQIERLRVANIESQKTLISILTYLTKKDPELKLEYGG
jgi:hypothetical protein